MNRIEDIVSAVKLEELKNMVKVGDLLQKKEKEEKKKTAWTISMTSMTSMISMTTLKMILMTSKMNATTLLTRQLRKWQKLLKTKNNRF